MLGARAGSPTDEQEPKEIVMGFFGRMLGIEDDADRRAVAPRPLRAAASPDPETRALERYRYMLRTAPPETLEQAHAEAFAKLSPDQRRQLLSELTQRAPPSERAAIAATPLDNAQALGRVATRAEVRDPGVLERSLGSGAMGFGASLLSSFAMGFVGSMVAQSFFSALGGFGSEGGAGARPTNETEAGARPTNESEAAAADEGAEQQDPQADPYADDGADFGEDYEV